MTYNNGRTARYMGKVVYILVYILYVLIVYTRNLNTKLLGTVRFSESILRPFDCCVCVCVFFPFILDVKFVRRTSRGHTGFLINLFSTVRALIFLARRIQPFLSLADREVEFCVLTI